MAAVDVLVPCYNAGRYVGAALDSALAQGDLVARIIVVDDGSTDDSADVVRSFGPRVEYHSQANGGISSARNAAIARATAPYLAFLDADDLWTDRSLATRFEHLAADPGLHGVYAAASQFVSPEFGPSYAARFRFDPAATVVRLAGTFLVRRTAFERAGAFDTRLRVGEMIEWLARAEALGLRFDGIEHHSLRRRIHDTNTTLRVPASKTDYLRAVKDALNRKRAAKPAPP